VDPTGISQNPFKWLGKESRFCASISELFKHQQIVLSVIIDNNFFFILIFVLLIFFITAPE
jgi:hypothetical protein